MPSAGLGELKLILLCFVRRSLGFPLADLFFSGFEFVLQFAPFRSQLLFQLLSTGQVALCSGCGNLLLNGDLAFGDARFET